MLVADAVVRTRWSTPGSPHHGYPGSARQGWSSISRADTSEEFSGIADAPYRSMVRERARKSSSCRRHDVIGSSTFPTMSGFNPTLTIQVLAYMSADAIVNRYTKSPGPLL
jgi:gluconate 2-dehydrogenase alpha chain